MGSKEEILEYYDKLAKDYDRDRFENTYGAYIHSQEEQILCKYLNLDEVEANLDLACGTGRFLAFADHGADISKEMISVAKAKFPSKQITLEDAEDLSFSANTFQNVLSFHLLMHLDKASTRKVISEVHRVLKPGGQFLFDIPSRKRRELSAYRSENWHGANHLSIEELKEYLGTDWRIKAIQGIAFFPVHRIPKKLRKLFVKLDNLLAQSFLKEYSSYLLIVLQKND